MTLHNFNMARHALPPVGIFAAEIAMRGDMKMRTFQKRGVCGICVQTNETDKRRQRADRERDEVIEDHDPLTVRLI